MVRVEKMLSDEQVQGELDVYNPLIPEPGELSATLFIELTSEAALREWLGKLVGIERAAELRLGGSTPTGTFDVVHSVPESAHEEALTREAITSSVHYVRFSLTPEQVELFANGPVRLAIAHRSYDEETTLSEETRQELLGDLRP